MHAGELVVDALVAVEKIVSGTLQRIVTAIFVLPISRLIIARFPA